MTDNARIVREALEAHTSGYAEESSISVCSGCGASIVCKPDCPVQEAITALDCLETELATTKAELARAREEERERIIVILTGMDFAVYPWDGATAGRMLGVHQLRAALAPEQKGE